ncbi:hypothetical protein Paride_0242 [Pseudomonas phage Paride]|nr:hypothetical protein Deiofobo_0242 [Pseudomonas phage Deifobo]WPK39952.1 hypothetical protein ETTORE_0243 [Pseudomonas phage Ettore]WPK40472.1 hypothetical protein Paride_0242 [Pseudomonas phage Paride]
MDIILFISNNTYYIISTSNSTFLLYRFDQKCIYVATKNLNSHPVVIDDGSNGWGTIYEIPALVQFYTDIFKFSVHHELIQIYVLTKVGQFFSKIVTY